MTETATALALKQSGYSVHLAGGVWWRQVTPFFCKPVDPLRPIAPAVARPSFLRSLIGYSHVVSSEAQATGIWPVMLLPEDFLSQFCLDNLGAKKRTGIRKALQHVTIKRIEQLLPCLERMNHLSVSVASRTGHGHPPSYYLQKRKSWEQDMLRLFSIPGREWWGAYIGETLVAYLYAYLVSSTMYIAARKSDSEFFGYRPNDALIFGFLEYCRNHPGCRQVVSGDWSPDTPTLNEFKEQYGFSRTDIPVYRHRRLVPRVGIGFAEALGRKMNIAGYQR